MATDSDPEATRQATMKDLVQASQSWKRPALRYQIPELPADDSENPRQKLLEISDLKYLVHSMADELKKAEIDFKLATERADKAEEQLRKDRSLRDEVSSHVISDVLRRLDETFRFFCGINYQDHSVQEQREIIAVLNKIRTFLQGGYDGDRVSRPAAK